ncbi:MAG: MBL fold metallo-hydrolase, partial [Deltaproteobacteria bacterium]
MQIRFVGHASFEVQTGGVRLVCDPWLSGKVFNNGWALLSRPAQVDWSSIDYVWISHEHPDHMHLPTLRSVPEAERR